MKVLVSILQEHVERVEGASAALCAVASDERPLRGPAGALDWRLCGLLSRQLLQQRFEGRTGEDLLIAAGPRLPFEQVFLIGLGRGADIDPPAARRVATRAGTVAVRAGVPSLVMGLWDLTRERIEFPEALNAFLIGAATGRAHGGPVEQLHLLLLARNPAEAGRMKHDLDRIARKPPVEGMAIAAAGG